MLHPDQKSAVRQEQIDAEGQHYRRWQTGKDAREQAQQVETAWPLAFPLNSVRQSPVRREPARAASLSCLWRQLATRKINGFLSVTKVTRIPHFLKENVSYVCEVLTIFAPGMFSIDNDKDYDVKCNASRERFTFKFCFVWCHILSSFISDFKI